MDQIAVIVLADAGQMCDRDRFVVASFASVSLPSATVVARYSHVNDISTKATTNCADASNHHSPQEVSAHVARVLDGKHLHTFSDTSVASSALCTKFVILPFPTASFSLLPLSPDNEVSELLQALSCVPWQTGYPMFQNRPRLTHKIYLSMNSRYTNFCCTRISQFNSSAHVLNRQPKLNAKMIAILFV